MIHLGYLALSGAGLMVLEAGTGHYANPSAHLSG
jgi:hypothetical protein